MVFTVAIVGEVLILDMMLGKIAADNISVKLFVNDHVPTATDTAADYTEMSGFGYVEKILVPSGWTVTGGIPSQAVYDFQEFDFTGSAGLIYGYYLVQTSSGILILGDRFTTPKNIVDIGDAIRITPRILLS